MGQQKYNVLYVDDEQSNLRVFKTINRHYYNIYSAISAEEAFLILENNPIHLIISDQRMPGMTGVEFLKEVKKKWPEPKCILLTAYSDHEILKEAINVVGIWQYINKPYDHDDLRSVMDNALEAYQLKIDKDILNSERLRAEKKIKESEEEFRSLAESAPVFILKIDADRKIKYINQIYEGFKTEDVIGSSMYDFILKDYHEKVKSKFDKVFKTGKPEYYESIGINPAKEEIWYATNVGPIFKDGKVESVMLVSEDITEKRKARQELLESELQKRLIFETALDGIITINQKGEIIDWNTQAEVIFGWEKEEVMGKKLSRVIIPEAYKAKHEQGLKNYFKTGKGKVLGTRLEIEGIRKNGEIFPVELSINPMKVGDQTHFSGFVRDISQRKQAEQNLTESAEKIRNLNDELEERVKKRTAQLEKANREIKETEEELRISYEKEKSLGELKSRFVSTASHQFRTPLTVIRSNVELMQMQSDLMDDKLRPKFKKASERINDAVKRMTYLMDDVLILGKINAARVPFEPKITDVVSICQELVNEHNGIQNDGRKVNFKIEGKPAKLKLDEKLFSHTISNLLSNALKYSEGRGNPELALQFNKKSLKIRVTDNGIGIPENEIDNLFQPFFRAINASETPGTGLGLAISKEYTELNGGTIEVKSKQNEGTTFTLEFQAK